MNIGNILLAWGVITREQLDQAVAAQRSRPDCKLGEIIVELGFAAFDQVALCLAKQELLRAGKADMPDIERIGDFAHEQNTEAQHQLSKLKRVIDGKKSR